MDECEEFWERGGDARFAVAAPWGVEFQENILVFVDDFLVVVRYDDLDAALLLLRNGLALDTWCNLAVDKVLDESADIVMCKFLALVKREFLVLDGLLDGEGGPFVDLKVEVSGMGTERFGVDCSQIDFALEFLSDGLEGFRQGFTLFRGFGEDIAEGESSLGYKLATEATSTNEVLTAM